MLAFAIASTVLFVAQAKPGLAQGVPPGSLIVPGKEPMILPLKGTRVNADISGFGARVTVVQTFTNPSDKPIEAIYTFPLPADSAVDRMRMQVGDRVIEGLIKRREEARAIYQAAKNQGQAAALLDQERPNIFTQSLANILPNATVRIEISYVQLLKYEAGQFEFSFPMVVGPRFLGNAEDPGKIAPPIVPEGMRTGANISLAVNLDAGAPVVDLKSVLHQVSVTGKGPGRAVITLKQKDEIPNKDFILRYRTASDSVQSAFLAKYDPLKGGYFSLILLPPKAPTAQQIAPKEMIFVMDQSGSQSGFPIEKSKELTLKLIGTMNPSDTFNVMGFANGVNLLWPEPRPNTAGNRAEAAIFVKKLQANGGTQLRTAVEAALTPAADPKRVRLVVFNTDGFVGDEKAILNSIREHRGTSRMFTFGIGNSVNRYLIDGMSDEGRGDSEVVTLAESADEAVDRFVARTRNPILVDVSATFDGIGVTDQLPTAIPDVFGEAPIMIYGRYSAPGQGTLTLRGRMAGQPWSKKIDLLFPSDREGGDSIPTLWARRMVDKIERESSFGMLVDSNPLAAQNQIIDLALEYGIMTQYTSFVAVEQRVINIGGKQRTVRVPIEMADGVSYEALGSSNGVRRKVFVRHADPNFIATLAGSAPPSNRGGAGGGGFVGGAGGSGGVLGGGGRSQEKSSGGTDYLAFNPATNAFTISDRELDALKPDEKARAVAGRRKLLIELKVAKSIRSAKGTVEVQVWLMDLKPETLAALKKLNLIVDAEDKGLNLVFGRCDARFLAELAQLQAVKRIEPIG
jgi:Ca-activated chloride channel homolog